VLPEWGGRWSLRTAEKHLSIEPGDIGSLSKSTIDRILLNHDLKPHRSRYFLNITDPDFFPKMELLIIMDWIFRTSSCDTFFMLKSHKRGSENGKKV